ncbi:hypothetical protein ACA910_014825 [Epithemia clementina (nom. ined.)]
MQQIQSLCTDSHIKGSAVVASPRILKPYKGLLWKSLLAFEPDLFGRSTRIFVSHASALRSFVVAATLDDDKKSNSQPHSNKIQDDGSDQGGSNQDNNNNNGSQTIDLSSTGATLDRVTALYDLNANAIARMAKLLCLWSHQLEVVVHCKMPIFLTLRFCTIFNQGELLFGLRTCLHVTFIAFARCNDRAGQASTGRHGMVRTHLLFMTLVS